MEPSLIALAPPEPAPAVSLPANLFTSCGKLAVRITSLGDDRAAVRSATRPPVGSFAFLVRNGVKIPATVAWCAGGVLGLSLEDMPAGARRTGAFRRDGATAVDKPLVRVADPTHAARELQRNGQG